MTAKLPPEPDLPPISPWVKSRWSPNIYTLTFRNFQQEGGDLIAELERDSSGAIYGSMRVDGEMYEVNEGLSMANWPEAIEGVLLRVSQFFQGRLASGYVTKFLPFTTDAQYMEAFGVSQSTASVWKRGKGVTRRGKVVRLKRQSISQMMMALGFRFPLKGTGFQRLTLVQPMWSPDVAEDALKVLEMKGKKDDDFKRI